jgi:hypothetical protein
MTVVCMFVAVLTTVAVSVVVDEDGQTPHDSYEEALPVATDGFTSFELCPETAVDETREIGMAVGVVLPVVAGEDGVDALPQPPHEADGAEASATPAAVDSEDWEWPSQLPQDAPDPPFPPPHDESSPAGFICQLPQPAEASRFSTTPPRTELANASRTNELFTMVARANEGVDEVVLRYGICELAWNECGDRSRSEGAPWVAEECQLDS